MGIDGRNFSENPGSFGALWATDSDSWRSHRVRHTARARLARASCAPGPGQVGVVRFHHFCVFPELPPMPGCPRFHHFCVFPELPPMPGCPRFHPTTSCSARLFQISCHSFGAVLGAQGREWTCAPLCWLARSAPRVCPLAIISAATPAGFPWTLLESLSASRTGRLHGVFAARSSLLR